jgi:ABC-type nickel/cobalt efflux system permease component RcnA
MSQHQISQVHDHGFGGHTHVLPEGGVTWRSLLALGVSGGLLPCPSALVLGLGAIALGRAAYGLALIAAFSLGLAATLVALGLVAVYSGRVAGRLPLLATRGHALAARWPVLVRLLPVGSAAVVSLAGLALSLEALRQLGGPG